MRQRRLMNQINVVPYIDVMLVLLVIFMVTAPMVQPGIIDVPSAGTLPAPPARAVVIGIKKDGSLTWQSDASMPARDITPVEFHREIAQTLAATPEQPFLVAADKGLEYQKVIDVLETARSAGVRKISLQTSSAKGS